MSYMTRQVLAVRVGDTDIRKIEELAEDETEGNLSQMIRKLLREALEARGL